ncbi:uncharacterized protein BDV14DRAFT_182098 [Aspergillus stella-maris]|uniref:uncharacterized protein n=1 Tax=Aspergillus stella-maris TaxID=1810926 RepID=UPI003CCD2F4B
MASVPTCRALDIAGTKIDGTAAIRDPQLECQDFLPCQCGRYAARGNATLLSDRNSGTKLSLPSQELPNVHEAFEKHRTAASSNINARDIVKRECDVDRCYSRRQITIIVSLKALDPLCHEHGSSVDCDACARQLSLLGALCGYIDRHLGPECSSCSKTTELRTEQRNSSNRYSKESKMNSIHDSSSVHRLFLRDSGCIATSKQRVPNTAELKS